MLTRDSAHFGHWNRERQLGNVISLFQIRFAVSANLGNRDVADQYPEGKKFFASVRALDYYYFLAHAKSSSELTRLATVRGVDLFPPPVTWVPPNCVLEVDDVQRPWTWKEPFDLIHIRQLLGSFTPEGWRDLYQQCYE